MRYPDKPILTVPDVLETLRPGEWLCQMKMDGWRCLVAWDGKAASFTSRHNKPIPASDELCRAVVEWLSGRGPMLIDAEYMGRRDGQSESLFVFDVLEADGRWVGSEPALTRWRRLEALALPDGELVRRVECVADGYAAAFARSKGIAGCEGVVLKRADSRFIGSVRGSVDNPAWLKCKWRAGFDGQLRVA